MLTLLIVLDYSSAPRIPNNVRNRDLLGKVLSYSRGQGVPLLVGEASNHLLAPGLLVMNKVLRVVDHVHIAALECIFDGFRTFAFSFA